MNLVLIETSGNQSYVFATNKLRENVGASELTHNVGTQIVLRAVRQITTEERDKDNSKQIVDLCFDGTGEDEMSGKALRAALTDENRNPDFKDGKSTVEVLIATSGKAMLLCENKEIAERVISEVTADALREMPGLTVHGAISDDFELSNDADAVHQQVGEVHKRLETVRYAMPNNHERFLRLPFVAPCGTSGLPASKYDGVGIAAERGERSVVSQTKRAASSQGQARLEAFIKSFAPDVRLIKNIDQLEKRFDGLDWLAVIHADGNGLGEIFLNFDKCGGVSTGREYVNKYRQFSIALDECTLEATARALVNLQQRYLAELAEGNEKLARQTAAAINRQDEPDPKSETPKADPREIPVVPLVLGGDDLSVICDGRYAIKFTHDFLCEFERQTANNDIIKGIAGETFAGIARLSICAGIAIVKPHFPFHTAYELAASLLKSAKKVKEQVIRPYSAQQRPANGLAENLERQKQVPCSALDYHILYDSSGANLEAIRAKLKLRDKLLLYARPYVVTLAEDLDAAQEESKEWFEPRLWSELETRVAAMLAVDKKEDDGRRKLPNSQLHDLRESLFLGKKEADARAKLVAHRYASKGFDKIYKNDSLFFPSEDAASEYATNFLDALDITEFRKGEKVEDDLLIDKTLNTDDGAHASHNQ